MLTILIIFYSVFVFISDVKKITESFLSVNVKYIFIIIPMLLFSQFLRSFVQKNILEQLNVKLSLKDNYKLFLSGLMMVVTPGGAGQAIKSHFLYKKYGYSISQTIPLVFIERVFDLIGISFVTLFTLVFFLRIEAIIAVGVSLSITGFILVVLKSHVMLEKCLASISKSNFLRKLFVVDDVTIISIEKIFTTKNLLKNILVIYFVFFVEGLIIYLGFMSFNTKFDYIESLQIFYTSTIFGVLSFVPGGLGITEITLTSLINQKINSISNSTSIVIFIRLTTIWASVIIGAISYNIFLRKQ